MKKLFVCFSLFLAMALLPPLSAKTADAAVLAGLNLDSYEYFLSSGDIHMTSVMAVYADGTEIDVTSAATYAASDPAVAVVNRRGTVTAAGSGKAFIEVAYGGFSCIVDVTVFASPVGEIIVNGVTVQKVYTDDMVSVDNTISIGSDAEGTTYVLTLYGGYVERLSSEYTDAAILFKCKAGSLRFDLSCVDLGHISKRMGTDTNLVNLNILISNSRMRNAGFESTVSVTSTDGMYTRELFYYIFKQ